MVEHYIHRSENSSELRTPGTWQMIETVKKKVFLEEIDLILINLSFNLIHPDTYHLGLEVFPKYSYLYRWMQITKIGI